MKIPGFLKTERAMTLTEVMISIALIALLGGAILGLMIQSMKMGQTIDYHYAAINIAKSRMDRIRELRRDLGFNNIYTASENNVRVNRDGVADSDGDFTRTTTITTNFDGNPNLTKVEVVVSYKGTGDVSTTTIALSSILSPYI